ncbi:MAG: hypothetical protein NZ742_04205, partial [Acidobacteria bacterium]|nr:hypothetical protein [Acidobacteriota bacterium]
GLWKTTNGGITWTPIFERQGTISIGDIALEPGHPDVIWVGTGEDNPRNSVSFGDGVYKSTDGGKTWRPMGLKDTERISRIIVHPANPDIVYVAAIGHVFGPNPDRGVFMTTDGGKTWQKVLYTDDRHGASDLEMDPSNPNILYAALWHFERKPWKFESGDEAGGVYKSVDGGRTWKKLTNGLPQLMGRIGVKVAPSQPHVVYVIVEAREGSLYRSDDRGETFRVVYKEPHIVNRGFYYAEIRVDPADADRVYAMSLGLFVSLDGGKTFRRIARSAHGDFHTLWIDPTDPSRLWVGDDGGLFLSHDRGETWEYVNTIPLGQFYQVAYDLREPFYYVCGGLQDNGTWCGPSRTRHFAVIPNDFWYLVSYGDGFHVAIHPKNPDLYLTEFQGGGILRTELSKARQQDASPQPKRNDGGPVGELTYRFNWNAPIVPSPHDPDTVYFGANVLFQSTDFGRTWRIISPDLTTNDPEKQKTAGGPVFPENTTAEYHCTITAVGESPVQKGVLWVGTDDGNVQVSPDGGQRWADVSIHIKGLPPNSPVSHVEPSRTGAGVAYVTFDRHMFDDFRPYVFKTTDFGQTWTNITGNLPEKGYVHVLREDPRNPNVLYVGTELGIFVSFTGGRQWVPLQMKNLPTVAVHDIQVHPRDNDLIVGTHGRGIWILDDITFLQVLPTVDLQKPAYLLPLRPALLFDTIRTRITLGDKPFRAENPPYGALITYYLREPPDERVEVKIQILRPDGKVIRELKKLPREKGLNRIAWDLRYEPPRPRREAEEGEVSFFGAPRGPRVLPGTYTVKLIVGPDEWTQTVDVRLDPTLDVSASDLQAAHDTALRLRDMMSGLNDALRALDSVEAQAKQLQSALRTATGKAPDEVTRALQETLQGVETLRKELVRDTTLAYGYGPKLLDHVRSLFSDIDQVLAAPTPYQMAFFRQLQAEYKAQVGKVYESLRDAAQQVNDLLQKHGLGGGLLVGKPPQE